MMQKILKNKKFVLALKIYTFAILICIGAWSYLNKVSDPLVYLRISIIALIPAFLGMTLSINARKK
jgi:hypothetical protein